MVVDFANSPSFEDKAVLEFFRFRPQPSCGGGRSGRCPAPCRAIHRRNRPVRQWLFPRQGRPRETDRDLRHPLHHHPLDPVPGIPRRHRRFKCGWKRRPVRPACSSPSRRTTLLPSLPMWRSRRRETRIVEIAGPERAPFNEFVARYLKAVGDPREVVSDPEARYFGSRVEERSLVPLGEARLGHIGFDEWLRRSPAAA